MDRIILHVDMNNCYASIEAILNPKLRGFPIAVCGSEEDRSGIVLAKSQEAKILGVKTAETIWEAKKKCPELLVVPPHYDEYIKYSKLAKKLYYEYTNQVESFGLDECWLDITNSINLFGNSRNIAEDIRERMKREIGITVSIGISFNKVFAKLGSDLKKPDAITEITKDNYKKIVWKLEVDKIIGIGKATKKRLNSVGIFTLGELAKSDPGFLKRRLGINGIYLWNYANGRDFSRVMDMNDRAPIKSIGHSITCREDLIDDIEVRNVFQELSLGLSKRLRDNDLEAGGIRISIKDNELRRSQYQSPLPYKTLSSIIISEEGFKLFKNIYNWKKPIRALGIRAIDLRKRGEPKQINLFSNYHYIRNKEIVDRTIYDLRKRYGEEIISFGSLIGDIKLPKNRNHRAII
ncbi:MAG: DNA polymerase IV [Andreesenia angusta]|nr:DNA polymerase IV [Andreesenia angusta]